MAASGNPTQWGDNFPPQELLEEDIDSNRLFLYLVNGELEAVFAFILGPDPTYAAIEDGQWLDDTLPYGTVHRLASAGKAQGRGIGCDHLVSGALREPACRHPRRQQDHAAPAGKNGFTRCGVIHVADGTPRFAYQSLSHPAAGLKQNTPPKSPGLRMQSLPCRTAHAGFLFAPARSALRRSTVTERTKPRTVKSVLATNTDQRPPPHGRRPECKFVNEKCLKTLSFLCRMCYNNTRPCVRDRKLCAIGVQ